MLRLFLYAEVTIGIWGIYSDYEPDDVELTC